jgi:streptomycin 6-kinase
MLKLATDAEERQGAELMAWWRGEGAAPVLERRDEALLLERATGAGSLVAMARNGQDEAATRMICAAVAKLHEPRKRPPPSTLVPLAEWFQALEPMARLRGGVLLKSLTAAQSLLASPRDEVVLHGDIHHENVLDFGAAGWLAIDPKGLLGERGYDYANLICNPDSETALAPGRLARQVAVTCDAAGLERQRMLSWVLAYAGLSASWTLEDGKDASPALAIAEIAVAELEA